MMRTMSRITTSVPTPMYMLGGYPTTWARNRPWPRMPCRPRGNHRGVRMVVLLIAGALLVTGCTSGQRKAISETAVRNAVAIGGAKEFKDRGFPIKDGLHCTARATNSSGTRVSVSCQGTTTNGHTVALTGTTDDKSGSKGDFVGSVDGKELFRKTCVGC